MTRERVAALRAENPTMPSAEIAARLGLTKQRVSQILKALGLPSMRTRIDCPRDENGRRVFDRRSRTMCVTSTGAHAELQVCAHLLSLGYDVFRSVSPAARCDLIASSRTDYRTMRIEVRCAERNGKGRLVFSTHSPAESFDHMALVLRDGSILFQPELPA